MEGMSTWQLGEGEEYWEGEGGRGGNRGGRQKTARVGSSLASAVFHTYLLKVRFSIDILLFAFHSLKNIMQCLMLRNLRESRTRK